MPSNGNHFHGPSGEYLMDGQHRIGQNIPVAAVPSVDRSPETTLFTDPDALMQGLARWQQKAWDFHAYVLVIPAEADAYIVAGDSALLCQLKADADVGACCNATTRFGAVWGTPRAQWSGTVCDMSAARTYSHARNTMAELVITAIALGTGAQSWAGALYGTVALHQPGMYPQVIENNHARRLLKAAGRRNREHPESPGER